MMIHRYPVDAHAETAEHQAIDPEDAAADRAATIILVGLRVAVVLVVLALVWWTTVHAIAWRWPS